MVEKWTLVPSMPGVLASTHGRVMVAPYLVAGPRGGFCRRGGTPTFGAWSAGRRYQLIYRGKPYKVARLICEAYHGASPSDAPHCLHIDENARNNLPENLKWGTHKENMNAPLLCAWRRSGKPMGDRYPFAPGRCPQPGESQ